MLINDKVDAVYIPDSPSRIKATDYNQIKNEIQECITEAGLTPTKDVIQLPKALRTIAEASSTAAAEYAAQALASKNAAETASNNAEQSATLAESAKEDAQQSAQNAASAAATAVSSHNTDSNAHADIRNALAEKATSADVDEEISEINSTLARKQDDGEFHPEDYGWPDIRPAARPNSIVLLAGVKTDYSAYDNLGFTATCEGGYNVFIDGVQYGTTYASRSKCSITWSQYSATTGFPVTQPEALTAHIVQIVPATYGNTISAYQGARLASSGIEEQGILWAHFNLTDSISLSNSFSTYNSFINSNLVSITSVGDILKVSAISGMLGQSTDKYAYYSPCQFLPILDLSQNTISGGGAFNTLGLKKITIKNGQINQLNAFSANNKTLQKIKIENVSLQCSSKDFGGYTIDNFLYNAQSLQEFPTVDMTYCQRAYPLISNAVSLKDTYLDLGYATQLKRLGIYGTSQYPINGLKQLLVSPQAPFDYASAPQINVAYTGLDQNALVALFNSLPTVTAGQVINITGATGAAALTSEQLAIATDKGWTVTR